MSEREANVEPHNPAKQLKERGPPGIGEHCPGCRCAEALGSLGVRLASGDLGANLAHEMDIPMARNSRRRSASHVEASALENAALGEQGATYKVLRGDITLVGPIIPDSKGKVYNVIRKAGMQPEVVAMDANSHPNIVSSANLAKSP